MAMFEIGLLEIRDITGMSDEQLTTVQNDAVELSELFNSTPAYQHEKYLNVISRVGVMDCSELDTLRQFVAQLNRLETNYNFNCVSVLKAYMPFGGLSNVSEATLNKFREFSDFLISISTSQNRQKEILEVIKKLVNQPRNSKAIFNNKPTNSTLLMALHHIQNQLVNRPLWLSELLAEEEVILLSEITLANAFAFALYISDVHEILSINTFLQSTFN